jgi:hypothetical protein
VEAVDGPIELVSIVEYEVAQALFVEVERVY